MSQRRVRRVEGEGLTMPSPLLASPLSWGTLGELSQLLGRPYITVFRWVLDGTLAEFGIPCYLDHHHHWWVRLPPELSHSTK